MLAPKMILIMEILAMPLPELENRIIQEMKRSALLHRVGDNQFADSTARQNESERLELLVEQDDSGRNVVRFRNFLYGLGVDDGYRKQLEANQTTESDKEKAQLDFQIATWILEAVESREKTMLRVAQEVVDCQAAFLAGDLEQPKNLKMQTVADSLNLAVTTVIRAVNGKTIGTPRGLMPLRQFFTIAEEEVELHQRVDVILSKLTKLVETEDKSNPYSDDEIVKVFASRNIGVARRTITKYRKRLNIPNSSRRKRETN